MKRVYDPPSPGDGTRVLVDRLWPRGLTKDAAHVDEWLRDIAPSNELRRWYHHDPALWEEFRSLYRAELDEPARRAALARLVELARRGTVTLLYSSKETERNNATVLLDVVREAVADAGPGGLR